MAITKTPDIDQEFFFCYHFTVVFGRYLLDVFPTVYYGISYFILL